MAEALVPGGKQVTPPPTKSCALPAEHVYALYNTDDGTFTLHAVASPAPPGHMVYLRYVLAGVQDVALEAANAANLQERERGQELLIAGLRRSNAALASRVQELEADGLRWHGDGRMVEQRDEALNKVAELAAKHSAAEAKCAELEVAFDADREQARKELAEIDRLTYLTSELQENLAAVEMQLAHVRADRDERERKLAAAERELADWRTLCLTPREANARLLAEKELRGKLAEVTAERDALKPDAEKWRNMVEATANEAEAVAKAFKDSITHQSSWEQPKYGNSAPTQPAITVKPARNPITPVCPACGVPDEEPWARCKCGYPETARETGRKVDK